MGHRVKMRKISGEAVAPEQSLAYCGMASQADVRHLRASDSGFFFCGLTVLQRIPVTEGAAFTSRNCSPPDRTLAIYVAHLVSLPHFNTAWLTTLAIHTAWRAKAVTTTIDCLAEDGDPSCNSRPPVSED